MTAHQDSKNEVNDLFIRLENGMSSAGKTARNTLRERTNLSRGESNAAAKEKSHQLESSIKESLNADAKLAKDEICNRFLPLVKSIARTYETIERNFEDIVQDGYVGLLSAILRFDHSRENTFGSFAEKWIRGEILKQVPRGKLLHMSHGVSYKLYKLQQAQKTYLARTGENPSDEYLAKDTGMPIGKIRELKKIPHVVTSPFLESDEDGAPYSLPATEEEDAVMRMEREQTARVLREHLNMLPDKDADLLRRKAGLDCEPVRMADMAKSRRIHRASVKMQANRAEAKLRKLLKESGHGETDLL